MQSSSLGRCPDERSSGSTGRGHVVQSNRVSTIVRGSAAVLNSNTASDLDRIRRATFVKPAPVVPISVQNPRTMSRNNNVEACSPMSISTSPSPSTDPQYKRPVSNSHSRPILLENGAKAYVTKDSIEVVSSVHVVRDDSSRVDNFKTPLLKTSYSPSSTVGRKGTSLKQPSAQVIFDVMDIGQKDIEVIEEKIISSSTVSSTTSSPSSRPAVKKGIGRPRKQVAKRSPPRANRGKF